MARRSSNDEELSFIEGGSRSSVAADKASELSKKFDKFGPTVLELKATQKTTLTCTGVNLGLAGCAVVATLLIIMQLVGIHASLSSVGFTVVSAGKPSFGPLPMRVDAQCGSTLTPPLKECAAPVVCDAAKGCKGHILVTGGAGYIGSHTTLHLLEAGYEVTVVDNLINSSPESLKRVAKLTGKGEKLRLLLADIRDGAGLEHVFRTCGAFDAVIHFAGLKAVGESVSMPIGYYDNNVQGTLNLVKYMRKYNVRSIIFSSSATVYGSGTPPFAEDAVVGQGITNPYGQTKYAIERILDSIPLAKDGKQWSVIKLRYFNPVGAHPSGLIGEAPNGVPNNLMPYVMQTAIGIRKEVTVYGNDWPGTKDGTGERDYIHVMDLASGHLKALEYLTKAGAPLINVFNLGTGEGTSVLQMIHAFEKACSCKVAYKIGPRRVGDVAQSFCIPTKAQRVLKWKATHTIQDSVDDMWRWIKYAKKQPYAACDVERVGFTV